MLEISGLKVRYGDRTVLDIDGAAFGPGATTVVLGPNGAGKTTLLKCLSGLLKPQEGSVRLEGYDVCGMVRRRVGIVLQHPVLFSGTVVENVSYGLRCRGMSRRSARETAAAWLRRWGMAHLAGKKRNMLSGGERQRVALLRTLVLEPDVLLLDEPFTFLDEEASRMLVDVIRRVKREGDRVLIIATHDLEKGYAVADEMVSLIHGRLGEHRPVNLFRGVAVVRDGLRGVELPGGLIIRIAQDVTGPVTAAVDPAAITLSGKRQVSTARNNIPGNIVAMKKNGELVRVVVDAGVSFHVDVTPQACRELVLGIGTPVWISFKASSVRCVQLLRSLTSPDPS